MTNPTQPVAWKCNRRLLLAVTCATALATCTALLAAGRANAAATIATAPAITPDSLISGNLATGPDEEQGDYNYCQWWMVEMAAHDEAQISGSAMFGTTIYSPGTNDSNYAATSPVAHGHLNTGFSWTASAAGTYPVAVCGSAYGFVIEQASVGPFTFQVNIYHSAKLYAEKRISTGSKGELTVYVRDVAGNAITSPGLTVGLYGTWRDAPPVPATNHLLAQGHPVNGVVRFKFRLPRRLVHKSVPLVITGSGSAYQKMSSLVCTDHVR